MMLGTLLLVRSSPRTVVLVEYWRRQLAAGQLTTGGLVWSLSGRRKLQRMKASIILSAAAAAARLMAHLTHI